MNALGCVKLSKPKALAPLAMEGDRLSITPTTRREMKALQIIRKLSVIEDMYISVASN